MMNSSSRSELQAAVLAMKGAGGLIVALVAVSVLPLPFIVTLLVALMLGAAAMVALVAAAKALERYRAALGTCLDVVAQAADGQLDARVVQLGAHGELQDLGAGINRLLDLTEAFTKEAQAAMEYANHRRYFRKILPTGLRGNFILFAETINESLALMGRRDAEFNEFVARNVVPVANTVSTAATALTASAASISELSSETQRQSGTASAGAGEASSNVQSVATAIEEFTASIGEINTQIVRTAAIASDAVSAVSKASGTITSLGEAADRIGSVVALISEIAEQTKLLSLNATIEAARAGEAGKGFAVVASEIKTLAGQTAKATDEITSQIARIQEVSRASAEAVGGIVTTVKEIQEAATVVAGAIEEQNAVTTEIARNINQAADATSTVSSAVHSVDLAASETRKGTSEVADAAIQLSRSSDALRGEIEAFQKRMIAA